MKQVIKIHDVITSSHNNVSHDDPRYELEITRNTNRPELVNLRIGSDGPIYVVDAQELRQVAVAFSLMLNQEDRIQ